jgi:hypothetical protein
MAKVALIQVEESQYGSLELSFISSFLKRHNHEIQFAQLSSQAIYKMMEAFNPQYIIFVTSENASFFTKIAELISSFRKKDTNFIFILAGPLIFLFTRIALERTKANYAICGGAIPAIQDIIDGHFESPGVAYIENDQVIINNPGKNNVQLWEVDPSVIPQNNMGSYFIVQSIGCNYGKCSFCPLKLMHPKIEIRDLDSVIKDMKAIANYHKNVNRFVFRDQNFLMLPKRLIELDSVMSKEGLFQKIVFASRADSVLENRRFLEAAISRIHEIHIGIESFVDSMLTRFSKGVTALQNHEAIKLLLVLGIPTRIYFISADRATTLIELSTTSSIFSKYPEYLLLLYNVSLQNYLDDQGDDYKDFQKLYNLALEGIVKLNLSNDTQISYQTFYKQKAIPADKKSLISVWFTEIMNIINLSSNDQITYLDGKQKIERLIPDLSKILINLYAENNHREGGQTHE